MMSIVGRFAGLLAEVWLAEGGAGLEADVVGGAGAGVVGGVLLELVDATVGLDAWVVPESAVG